MSAPISSPETAWSFASLPWGIIIPTAIGVLVSLATFWFGYRQTVGARKERARLAGLDIERIILKRMVLETFEPSAKDVARLRQGKAIEYNVDIQQVAASDAIVGKVFSSVLDNDFISKDQRARIGSHISNLLESIEHEAEAELPLREEEKRFEKPDSYLEFTSLVVGAAALGTAAAALPVLVNLNRPFSSVFLGRDGFLPSSFVLLLTLILSIGVTTLLFRFLIAARARRDAERRSRLDSTGKTTGSISGLTRG